MRLGGITRRIPWGAAAINSGLLVTFATFLVISTYRLDRPGLEYDETLFVNAAVGGSSGSFIQARLFGVPVMLMSYIGALKAYLYYPIFKLFGVSVVSIRLPVILVTLGTLVLTWRVARRLGPRGLAVLVVAALATQPALIFPTRLDWGPDALMTFLKIASIESLLLYVESGRLRFLALLCSCLLLGIFDKLSFLWFAGTLLIAIPIALGPEVLASIRTRVVPALAIVSGSLVAAGAFLFAVQLPAAVRGTSEQLPMMLHLQRNIDLYRATFNGSAIYYVLTSEVVPGVALSPFVVLVTGATVFVAAMLAFIYNRRLLLQREFRLGLFFSLLFCGTFLAMLPSGQPNGPHHLVALWGLPELALASCLGWAWKLAKTRGARRIRSGLAGVAIVGILVLIGSQLAEDFRYLAAFQSGPFSAAWSPAIYPLSAFMNCRAPWADEVVVADWGIANQLTALAPAETRAKYADMAFPMRTVDHDSPDARRALATSLFASRNVLVVAHTAPAETFSGTQQAVLELVRTGGYHFADLGSIAGDDHVPVFEVYFVQAKSLMSGNQTPSLPRSKC